MANLVENNRNNNHAKLLNVLRKHRQLLKDLATSLQGSPEHDWSFSQKSPLRKRKLEQFQEFRKQLLEGRSMKTDDLFDGPFLRSEFGENAERIQQMEMRRFAPLFKEMIERFSSEPKDLLDQLMRMLQLPKDSSGLKLAQSFRD